MNYQDAVKNIRKELKTYIQKNNIKSLVIGISGGMDSCLCAALARPVCDELGISLIGRSLPTKSTTQDERDRAIITGKLFCHNFKEDLWVNSSVMLMPRLDETNIIDVDEEFNTTSWLIRLGNIKARLRMIYLYNLASLTKGIVLSTDNFTEYLLGFWTLHGDVGDYGMIQELWKTEVYNMSEWIRDNECKDHQSKECLTLSINALATDGLGVTTTGDLGQITPDWKGSSRDGYKIVDDILEKSLEDYFMPDKLNSPVIQRHLNTKFKRNNPINIPRDKIFKREII
jgi:NAD+ synthase